MVKKVIETTLYFDWTELKKLSSLETHWSFHTNLDGKGTLVIRNITPSQANLLKRKNISLNTYYNYFLVKLSNITTHFMKNITTSFDHYINLDSVLSAILNEPENTRYPYINKDLIARFTLLCKFKDDALMCIFIENGKATMFLHNITPNKKFMKKHTVLYDNSSKSNWLLDIDNVEHFRENLITISGNIVDSKSVWDFLKNYIASEAQGKIYTRRECGRLHMESKSDICEYNS